MALPAQDSSEELKAGIQSKFTHLRKALEDFQCQTVASIEQEQVAALGHVEKNWNLLKDHLDVLGQHRERAESLLACPDHRTFLQVPLALCPSLCFSLHPFDDSRIMFNPFPTGNASSVWLRDVTGL